MWLLSQGLDHRPNRTAAQDLAERAQWSNILAGVKVRGPPPCNTAKTDSDGVMVKDFD
jgi:hypothetical protein